MRATVACAVSAAITAVALATTPAAIADPEDDFLTLIAAGGITWPSEKTALVIETGYGVCNDWDSGTSFEQEIADLTEVTGWSDYQAEYFIGAATSLFCPEYEDKIS